VVEAVYNFRLWKIFGNYCSATPEFPHHRGCSIEAKSSTVAHLEAYAMHCIHQQCSKALSGQIHSVHEGHEIFVNIAIFNVTDDDSRLLLSSDISRFINDDCEYAVNSIDNTLLEESTCSKRYT
jgi:hypothetical protein